MILRRVLTACLPPVLAACTTLGPNYSEPDPAWLADWQPDLYGQLADPEDGAETDLSRWWQQFADPALNALVAEALRENRGLQVAGLRVLEARAQLGAASALNFPQLQQVGGTAQYVDQRQRDGLLPDRDDTLVAGQANLTVGWELDFWGRFRRSIEAADAAFLASVANQRDAQVLLIAQTVDAYYAYRTVEERIAIAEENARIQERSLQITTQLYESGQESELDLQQARTQYLSTLATIPGLQASLTKLRNVLALLLARPPGDLPELALSSPTLPSLPPVALRAVPAELLLRRPDVRRSAWAAGAQSARIGIARADLYPSISILGSFGLSGDTLDSTADVSRLALGPAINWNIFDYGILRGAVRVEDARLQQALVAFDNTLLSAAREVDDAAVDVVRTAQSSAVLVETEAAARRALELANSRYLEGYAGFQRVLDAQRALALQTDNRVSTEGAHISAVVALYKALGGGWQSAASMTELIPPAQREQLRERVDWAGQLESPLPQNLDAQREQP